MFDYVNVNPNIHSRRYWREGTHFDRLVGVTPQRPARFLPKLDFQKQSTEKYIEKQLHSIIPKEGCNKTRNKWNNRMNLSGISSQIKRKEEYMFEEEEQSRQNSENMKINVLLRTAKRFIHPSLTSMSTQIPPSPALRNLPLSMKGRLHHSTTRQGKRPYNQDRFLITLDCNIENSLIKRKGSLGSNYIQHSTIQDDGTQMYAIFDGHGGSACSEWLKQNFSRIFQRNKLKDNNPEAALKETFAKSQQKFLFLCQSQKTSSNASINFNNFNKTTVGVETSGSCALVCLFASPTLLYVANLGDSRALLLYPTHFTELTRDHKPQDPSQKLRIIKTGGKIYKTHDSSVSGIKIFRQARVIPGNLNVSRTIGDIEIKLKKYGGLPGMISPQPEIKSFEIQQEGGLLLLGSDGLYEGLTNDEISAFYRKFWKSSADKPKQFIKKFVQALADEAEKKSTDNITIIAILL